MESATVSEMLAALDTVGFAAFSLSSADAAAALARQLGTVLSITQVRISTKPTYLASPDRIPPHTDHPDVPLILWYCNSDDASGAGASHLVDAKSVIQSLPLGIVKQLKNVQLRCPDLRGIEPTGTHPLLRPEFGDVFYAPWLCFSTKCSALAQFEREISKPVHQRSVMLKAGDALLVDNRRVLHFRDAVPPNSQRWLTRYWIGEPCF